MKRLDDEDLTPYEREIARTVRRAVEYCERRAAGFGKLSRGIVPETVLTSEPTRSALARRRQARQEIVIHWGLIASLWNTVLLLLTSSEEVSRAFNWPRGASRPENLDRYADLSHAWTADNHHTAVFNYAVAIFGRGIETIWFHEYAHLIRGHLELVAGAAVDEALHMAAHDKEAVDAPLIRNLELDADFFCVNLMMLCDGERFREEGRVGEDGIIEVGPVLSEVFFRTSAMMAVNLVFDRPDLTIEDQTRQDHPAAVHRAVRTTSMYLDAMHRRVALTYETLAHFVDLSWDAAAGAAEVCGLASGRWTPGDDAERRMPLYWAELRRAEPFIVGLNQKLGFEAADKRPPDFDQIAAQLPAHIAAMLLGTDEHL